MSVEIVPVRGRRALREFIDLPWRIYDARRHPRWVPPLRIMVREAVDTRRNPFYRRAERELFLAMRDGAPVGRIAAIENRAHNEFHGDRVGFFGFFEVLDDKEAATALFDAARAWLAARGLDTMRGPMSPSTNAECGLLVDGFDEHPMFMTPWNPPYYLPLVEGAGLAPAKDLLGYHFALNEMHVDPRYEVHAKRALASSGLSFRDLDLKRFAAELEICWDVYNTAWEKNWGFVPMTHEEFVYMSKEMKPLLIPQFAFIADVDGAPAGFLLLIPDFNEVFKRIGTGRLLPTGVFRLLAGKRKLRSGRVILLGVKPEYRSRSIFALFLHELLRRAREYGMTTGEASWVLEDNALMRRPIESLGGRAYRRWRVYETPIGPA